MMNSIKLFLASLIAAAGLIGLTVPVLAQPSTITHFADTKSTVCDGATYISGGNCDEKANGKKAQGLIEIILKVFAWFIGVIAVIMVIYGGFLYVTSNGDTNKVQKGRNYIVYALIGVVIVVISQVLVKMIIGLLTKKPAT